MIDLRERRNGAALFFFGCIALAGCKSASKPRPQHTGVFTACSDSLSGTFTAVGDSRFRYAIVDRGSSIEIEPSTPLTEPGPVKTAGHRFKLARDPKRELPYPSGALHFQATREKQRCNVELPARVTGCRGSTLVIASKRPKKIDWSSCNVEVDGSWNETEVKRAP